MKISLNRSTLLLITGTGALLSCSQHKNTNTESKKPNVLFLLADDLGYGELGCYGQKVIQTPVMDELADKGMRFTNFYAGCAVCSPSRAVLMTGLHSGHVSIRGNSGVFEKGMWSRVPLKNTEITLGEMMKSVGYQTAFLGKWHLDDPNDESTWAINRGFDYSIQEQWNSRMGGKVYTTFMHYVNGTVDSTLYNYKDYECLDHYRTDQAIEFLDQKDDEKPFFLFMSFRAPHAHEGDIRDYAPYDTTEWDPVEQRHAAKITLLDKHIGRLLKYLEEKGELSNTLILLTSDNGPHREKSHDHTFFKSAGELTGFKRELYEGGLREPFIVVWDGKVKPGTISNHIGGFQDFMPTLADITGAECPDNTDGISIQPELLGNDQPDHDYLYWELQLDGWWQKMPDGGFRQAIRKGNWKAVRYGVNSDTELYDISKDIKEQNNIAEQHPKIVEEMNSLFESARTESPYFPYGGVVQNEVGRKIYNELKSN